MITRIVKLTFIIGKEEAFLNTFEDNKVKVNSFPGCLGMQLLRTESDPLVFFTYSQWIDAESLERYRNSETFKTLWSGIKPWFAQRAEAWSTDVIFNGFDQSQ